MEPISGLGEVFNQFVRLLQIVGLPLFGGLFVIGLLVLLTAGKNPFRRRLGFVFSLGFGIGVLLVASVPLLTEYYSPDSPHEPTGEETVQGMVDSTTVVGGWVYETLERASLFIVIIMFYVGIQLWLKAARRPQQKRLGIGIVLFSPFILLIVHVLPKLIASL